MFWSELVPALLYGLGACVIPESPRYLVTRGDEPQARDLLDRIGDPDPDGRVAEIRRSLRGERTPRLGDLLGGRFGLLPVVWVGVGLSLLQQFVGINVIFYYGTALWQAVGVSEERSLFVNVITGLVNIGSTLIAIAWVDRAGRRPLLLAGSAGMFISLAVVAWAFSRAVADANGLPAFPDIATARAALIAANVYVLFFGFSWGPVVWVLLGEMFDNRIRGAALALAAAVQWIANFAVSTTFPPLSRSLGLAGCYALYTTFAAVSLIFVWTAVRETRGRTLEEMG